MIDTFFIVCMLITPFVFFMALRDGTSHSNFHAKPSSVKAYRSPFVDIEVKPVSDGDEIVYAIRKKEGGCVAAVENKNKRCKLYIEADCPYNLRKKIQETFKAWAMTGKKESGKLYF